MAANLLVYRAYPAPALNIALAWMCSPGTALNSPWCPVTCILGVDCVGCSAGDRRIKHPHINIADSLSRQR